jgi:hypothetical protein
MQRRKKGPNSMGGRTLEELLQADPQSLRMSGRHPITGHEGVAEDPPAEDWAPQSSGVAVRRRATRPDASLPDAVAGEVMRDIAELQDRVASRLAAEEAEPAPGGRIRTLVARARRRE